MTKHYGHESRSSGKNLLLLDFWLTIERGLRPTVKVNADFPNNLSRNQRTINLKMELPVELFETPTISAKISVEAPSEVVHIDASTIAEAVRGAIGMDVEINIQQPE